MKFFFFESISTSFISCLANDVLYICLTIQGEFLSVTLSFSPTPRTLLAADDSTLFGLVGQGRWGPFGFPLRPLLQVIPIPKLPLETHVVFSSFPLHPISTWSIGCWSQA